MRRYHASIDAVYRNITSYIPLLLLLFCHTGSVLGPTDPSLAPEGALRRTIKDQWEALGLGYEPTVGDNCVHASASPFEGLAERMNWLKVKPEEVWW